VLPIVVPLLALGTAGYLVRNLDTSRSNEPSPRSEPEPSPLTVLGAFLYMGETPPLPIVYAAIAHAESIGCTDLADELVRLLLLPAEPPIGATGPIASSVPAARAPTTSSASVTLATSSPTAAIAPTAGTRPGMHSGVVAADETDPEAQRVLAELTRPENRAAKVEFLPGAAAARDPEVLVSSKSSPIDGVGTAAWLMFVGRVSREPPTFTAVHHVGRFRQRRERLIELGIDPATIVGSPEAQLAAFDADMRDAYKHACASGLIDEYLGTTVEVRAGTDARPTEVTLSGVLGVIQAAGLEGAVQWLEQAGDRKRFPHTTQAFLRCNGVF
jgi:hypothetical protein